MSVLRSSVVSKTVTSSIDGIKIYAEAIGNPSNTPLVYIHGNSTCCDVWDNQFFNERLVSLFYQIRFDLRGHGRSETPNNESGSAFDNPSQASDVAAVLEAYSVKKVIFVAWSYGALIPADYVSVYGPGNVRGLVLIDGLTGPPEDVHKYFCHPPFAGFSNNGDATTMHQAYGSFIRALTYRPLPREWTLRLRGMLTETTTSTRAWIFKRKKDWTRYMNEASKTVPKLVIFGKEDGMNSIEFVGYIQTKWDSKLLTTKIIDEAGHAAFLEKPGDVNEALVDWVVRCL